jgi:hypothetical protein
LQRDELELVTGEDPLERVDVDAVSVDRERYDTRPTCTGDTVVIRRARDTDLPLLRELAALDCARPLSGEVLVALVEGQPYAALSLDDDRAIAGPFRLTAPTVDLLRLRAQQLRAAEHRPRRSLRRRWIAYRARA